MKNAFWSGKDTLYNALINTDQNTALNLAGMLEVDLNFIPIVNSNIFQYALCYVMSFPEHAEFIRHIPNNFSFGRGYERACK